MSAVQLKTTMRQMKLEGMFLKFDELMTKSHLTKSSLIEVLDTLLQSEQEYRDQKQITRLVSSAKIKHKPLLQDFDLEFKRGLKSEDIKSLYSLDWYQNKRDILVTGPTGVGKTFIVQALCHHCCLSRIRSLFLDFNQFLEEMNMARGTGQYLRFLKKIERPDVLVLDDFGLRKLTASEATDYCDVIKSRIDKSTIFTTQLPVEHWSEVLGDPVVADTIIDRLLHTSLKIKLKGGSYRKIEGEKLDELEVKNVASTTGGRRR